MRENITVAIVRRQMMIFRIAYITMDKMLNVFTNAMFTFFIVTYFPQVVCVW